MSASNREHIIETLRQRIVRGVQAGSLAEGDRLPSARDLQQEFDTDYRIILDAYRQLAEEGLVQIRERGGIYVAAPSGFMAGMPAISVPWLTEILTQGVTREIPLPELHEWIRRSVETLRLRAVAIAGTDDQIGGLVRELRDDFGLDAIGLLADSLGPEDAPALELRRADLIVVTGAHATAVTARAAAMGKPCVTITVRPDLIGGEWRLLLHRPVFVIVGDERFVPLLTQFFSGTPGAKNLRILLAGRDDLDEIPANAPVYVTHRARELLAHRRIPGRILPAARTVDRASAATIIEFIVRANLRAVAASLVSPSGA